MLPSRDCLLDLILLMVSCLQAVLGEIQQKNYETLWKYDQLIAQKTNNKAFDPFEEAPLNFPPSYKFDKGTSRYDTSEKQRVPAW